MARERQRQAKIKGKFEVTIDDIVAGTKSVDEAKARQTLAGTTDDEVDAFRARYASYRDENNWRYPNPMFERVLVEMLKRDGTMTAEKEREYRAVIKAYSKRTKKISSFDVLQLPSHYVILKILGCA